MHRNHNAVLNPDHDPNLDSYPGPNTDMSVGNVSFM